MSWSQLNCESQDDEYTYAHYVIVRQWVKIYRFCCLLHFLVPRPNDMFAKCPTNLLCYNAQRIRGFVRYILCGMWLFKVLHRLLPRRCVIYFLHYFSVSYDLLCVAVSHIKPEEIKYFASCACLRWNCVGSNNNMASNFRLCVTIVLVSYQFYQQISKQWLRIIGNSRPCHYTYIQCQEICTRLCFVMFWCGYAPIDMMTSSNGNNFRVTGTLCGECTSHRWIP